MATGVTNDTRVRRLRAEAAAKAAEAATLFAALTPAEAATRTEIGWTVAATAAHLAFVTDFTASVIANARKDRALPLPEPVIHAANFVTARRNARAPLATSVARLGEAAAAVDRELALLTDADLDHPHRAPFRGRTTFGVRLNDSLIGHVDQHLGQVRCALNRQEDADARDAN